MRTVTALVVVLLLAGTRDASAQTPPADSDFKPASSNVPGAEYPQIDSQRRARFRISAPQADKVELSLGGRHPMTKDENGVWTMTTEPLVVGFHYYTFVIGGLQVADPGSESYFGSSRWSSGIEVPEPGVDFYHARNVPHGEVRVRPYFSKVANAWRQAYIYTPPGYDGSNTRYPVLYLQHGAGEDERGWTMQGRAHFILDNLIAEGKARPMIVVMDNGGGSALFVGRGGGASRGGAARGANPAQTPAASAGGAPGGPATAAAAGAQAARGGGRGGAPGGNQFAQILIQDIVPMVESNYRTLTGRDNRAIAGLSMGAGQAWQIGTANLDTFAFIGGFSGGASGDPKTAYNGVMADANAFNSRVKVLYISIGTEENVANARAFHAALQQHGIRHEYFESQGTAHEWQTWRRSLHGFAPLLFRN
jgi:enterochelin esterase family protein